MEPLGGYWRRDDLRSDRDHSGRGPHRGLRPRQRPGGYHDHELYQRTWNGTAWEPPFWGSLGNVWLPTRYRFSVYLVRVDTARSLDNDTDYGQCSVRAGNWPTRTANQTIGDIGGTDYKEFETNLLYIDPVDLDFCEPATFNYSVITMATTARGRSLRSSPNRRRN